MGQAFHFTGDLIMKRAIHCLLLAIFVSPFSVIWAAEPEWIPPETTTGWEAMTNYCDGQFRRSVAPDLIALGYAVWGDHGCEGTSVSGNYERTNYSVSVEIRGSNEVRVNYMQRTVDARNGNTIADVPLYFDVQGQQTDYKSCTNPEYQNPVDSNSDGEVDQCWPSSCPQTDYFWSTSNFLSAPTGNICVKHPSGVSCQYSAIENTDGTLSNFTFQPNGSGCTCTQDNELEPCVNGQDGELTNYPQGANDCVQIADAIMCAANPEEHCEDGVCESGCGYVENRFVCIQTNVTDEEAAPCTANDTRFSCNGRQEGECPAGVLNCIDPNEGNDPNEPPACQENDTRESCVGVPVGEKPRNDMSGVEGRLDTVNKNLKDIKTDTKKIADELTKKHDGVDISPEATGWDTVKSDYDSLTADGHIPTAQTEFENNMSEKGTFLSNQIIGLFPSSSGCSPYSFQFKGTNITIGDCQTFSNIRLILEWVLVLAAVYRLYSLIMAIKPNGAN